MRSKEQLWADIVAQNDVEAQSHNTASAPKITPASIAVPQSIVDPAPHVSDPQFQAPVDTQASVSTLVQTTAPKPSKEPKSEATDSAPRVPFVPVKAYPEPVDPANVLDETAAIIRRYVVLSEEQAWAAALWIALTYFTDDVEVLALAVITAPEKACGKSQLLSLFGQLGARALSTANCSPAFFFRALEKWRVTLVIDEVDTFYRSNEEMAGLVNAGHTRANAFVGRTMKVGDEYQPVLYNVWGAKALAGINLPKVLPESTISRAIVFQLRRKTKDETVGRLRQVDRAALRLLASKLARFALDYAAQVRNARPTLPETLDDREMDNWEPIVAIAECAGPVWANRARQAAVALSISNEPSEGPGSSLLADIREYFDSEDVDRVKSADLLRWLIDDDEKGWATYNRGKPLTFWQLSRLLKDYGIKPKTVRFGRDTPKGFERAQFDEAFARYLPPVVVDSDARDARFHKRQANAHMDELLDPDISSSQSGSADGDEF